MTPCRLASTSSSHLPEVECQGVAGRVAQQYGRVRNQAITRARAEGRHVVGLHKTKKGSCNCMVLRHP